MWVPDLQRIVECHVPRAGHDLAGYVAQLRTDILPSIRGLQSDGRLVWFSFLQHPANQLLGRDDTSPVFHLRLEPACALGIDEFIRQLPAHFASPVHRPLSLISGSFDPAYLTDGDWARAWGIAGASSEWILCLLEAHGDTLPLEHVLQALHYVTNPLMPNHECQHVRTGARF